MPKENRFAGLGEAMESETESESDEEETPGEDAPDASEKSEPEPAGESETADESESEDASEKSDGVGEKQRGDGESNEGEELDEGDELDENDELDESEELDEAVEAAESDTGEESAEVADETGQTAEAEGGPAFEFEATTAKSIYVRTETLDRLDDAEFEVESFLRREHDVRDLTGREFHDALVRVAAEYPEEIADAVLETRDE
ncbi:hypothetical protein [Haloferax marisrubri]|uniref:Uncharacterized protein n=1 Tax=Haloferax marisrubri TaxID=1544719 RepID=A0A2P4NSY5_9EURY|nr:hypothetical protein [Haloferax marisrubri]POG56277.1 hypothetical protein AUR65_007130 [Haloferax marisrubri]